MGRPYLRRTSGLAGLTLADRPVVLEAYTDPNVPPLPPHITLAQARAFAGLLYGEPERGSVITETARQMLSTLMPGKR
jgi:pyruvate dehydrogenase (quinone)